MAYLHVYFRILQVDHLPALLRKSRLYRNFEYHCSDTALYTTQLIISLGPWAPFWAACCYGCWAAFMAAMDFIDRFAISDAYYTAMSFPCFLLCFFADLLGLSRYRKIATRILLLSKVEPGMEQLGD